MRNRSELRKARRKAWEAAESLKGIESLPRRVGQTVEWGNGVVWVRQGDDAWRPTTAPDVSDHWTYDSAHVAWGLGYGR